jgi:hypothetical protein
MFAKRRRGRIGALCGGLAIALGLFVANTADGMSFPRARLTSASDGALPHSASSPYFVPQPTVRL